LKFQNNLSAVTVTSRRIFRYWLLLFVAALGVGAGAWMLLRREEARLAARVITTEAARRAAVESRARLVAENVELLVGDVEAGLLDTLAEAPADEVDSVLAEWAQGNSLVHTTYRCAIDGRLLRPASSDTGDDARGFRRRFAAKLAENPPWQQPFKSESVAPLARVNAPVPSLADASESETRRKVEANVSSLQSARKETQMLAKTKSSYAPRAARKDRAAADFESDQVEKKSVNAPSAAGTDKRGWTPLVADGRLHLLGWVVPAGASDVRGVEVEMAGLISRLGGAMPSELVTDEGYALRDDKGRVVHQSGNVPDSKATPVARVALASTLLPGWEVVAFLAPAPAESSGGFFFVGVMLTGILVTAILVGGSLLLWQARLSEADAEQKTSFVANVSHEFKTPLTTIRLYSELLEQGRVPEGAKRTEYLKTIGRETQRLARLVNNVLDFSRLEQGRKKYNRESIDLTAVLAQLLDAHAPRIAESGLVLKRELPAEQVAVVTDRDAVEQIVLNLLDNACKYAGSGAEVVVGLRPLANGGAEVNVGDRGPGVPAAHREHIFAKFHRVDDTLTAEKGGAGLGLSIARQLARGLGGDLSYAERVGGGAEFVLNLP